MNLKLKARIVEKFGSQADFALAVGVDETVLSRIVRGRRQPSPEQAKVWAEKLSMRPERLFPALFSPPEKG